MQFLYFKKREISIYNKKILFNIFNKKGKVNKLWKLNI